MDAVVEQQLIARRGRKKVRLRLRVFAPTPDYKYFSCKFELRADDRVVLPHRPDLGGFGGVDSMQAFIIALRIAAFELLRFERDHGMKIDAWEWSSLIQVVGDLAIDPYMRERVTEIQTALRARQEEASSELAAATAKRNAAAANRKPRAAGSTQSAANRKPSAASRKPPAAARSRRRK